jgi:hypothetical protein
VPFFLLHYSWPSCTRKRKIRSEGLVRMSEIVKHKTMLSAFLPTSTFVAFVYPKDEEE